MTMIRVKLLTHHLGHNPGDVVEIDEAFARLLVLGGRARPVTKDIPCPRADKMERGRETK